MRGLTPPRAPFPPKRHMFRMTARVGGAAGDTDAAYGRRVCVCFAQMERRITLGNKPACGSLRGNVRSGARTCVSDEPLKAAPRGSDLAQIYASDGTFASTLFGWRSCRVRKCGLPIPAIPVDGALVCSFMTLKEDQCGYSPSHTDPLLRRPADPSSLLGPVPC